MVAFIPAVAAWIVPRVIWIWLTPIPPLHLRDVDVPNVQAIVSRELNLTGTTIAVCSLFLAVIFTRGQPARVPLANTLSVAFCLFVANTFVAFAGCAVFAFTR